MEDLVNMSKKKKLKDVFNLLSPEEFVEKWGAGEILRKAKEYNDKYEEEERFKESLINPPASPIRNELDVDSLKKTPKSVSYKVNITK